MGSPQNEPGRLDAEGPQHEVWLTDGFWLAETPCTQEFWEAVMGKNPSHFRGPLRPVEQVSWHDCQQFLEQLNTRLPECNLTLPTEAQWEYACRAGTTTALYSGPMRINKHRSAELDPIAWYFANSDSETKAVRKKEPNAWGLYDMLGNVREWCLDGQRTYTPDTAVNPIGSVAKGSNRAVRGGGWLDLAQGVRCAVRYGNRPVNRYYNLGLRFARVQESQ